MTDPKQSDNGWSLQDLPVLTEVVAESAGELEVPAFDFSAELDELARSMPVQSEPELELPPELSLDDVLGEEPPADDDAATLDASKLIERLPSLDLEVDEPGDLSLDDVLPGLAPVADVASEPVADADFAFDLPAEPQAQQLPPSAEAGLDALFARARFEPVLPQVVDVTAADDYDQHAANPATAMGVLQAQLEQFAEPSEMPELPADAFLSQGAEPSVALIEAAEPDPVWAENWQPEPVVTAEDTPLPPVVSAVLAAEPPLLEAVEAADAALLPADDWPLYEQLPTEVAQLAAEPSFPPPVLAETVPDEPVLDAGQPAEAVSQLQPDTSVDASQFHVSLDDLLASLQPAASAEAPGVVTAAGMAVVEDWPAAAEPAPLPRDEPVLPQPVSGEPVMTDVIDDLASPAQLAAAVSPAPVELASPEAEPAAEDGWPQEMLDDAVVAVDGEPDADGVPAAAQTLLQPDIPTPPAAAAVQSISIDSLPSGVLGGGLGAVDVATLAAAAQLGAAAGSLPGGSDWPLRQPQRAAASARDVELDWARDLHAEPPHGIALQDEPEAMVMRSRRLGQAEAAKPETAPVAAPVEAPFTMAAEDEPLPPFTMAPAPEPQALSAGNIRVESVTPPLAAMAALGGVNEEALIEALYARVLPRMKVELSLWMQDAMEQQAKQLISGVMQQLKEDFDMMLAQSLKESLREALDEVAPQHNKDN